VKNWAWIFIGGGVFTMLAGYLASRAKAQTPAPDVLAACRIPSMIFSSTDYDALRRLVAASATPAVPCHPDIQEAIDYYAAHRRANGSYTAPDGTTYPSFAAAIAATGGS